VKALNSGFKKFGVAAEEASRIIINGYTPCMSFFFEKEHLMYY